MRIDKQYTAFASTNLLNKLRKILKYLVPEFLLYFFYNCFVFHILLESKDLREKKGNTKHSGYKSKEEQTTTRALTHFKLLLFRITGT